MKLSKLFTALFVFFAAVAMMAKDATLAIDFSSDKSIKVNNHPWTI